MIQTQILYNIFSLFEEKKMYDFLYLDSSIGQYEKK